VRFQIRSAIIEKARAVPRIEVTLGRHSLLSLPGLRLVDHREAE
jgi:hypothetical protein